MDMLPVLVIAVLFIAICCEAKLAHKEGLLTQTLRQSYKTNFATFIFNNVALSLASVSSLLFVTGNLSGFGILNMVGAWKIPASFVLLDMTLYLWHRACHAYDWLWKFHKVHHSDLSMNVTTAFRVHVAEVFLATFVKAAFIIIMGVPTAVVLANEMIITLFVIFHHSHMTFRREALLGLLIVTPSQHRVHHSVLREEHDNNYGAIFSFWDRLFGTFIKATPAQLGLKDVSAQGFVRLFLYGLSSRGGQPLVGGKKDAAVCRSQ